jgi:hypothetical protein
MAPASQARSAKRAAQAVRLAVAQAVRLAVAQAVRAIAA